MRNDNLLQNPIAMQIKQASRAAGVGTASMGKYDQRLKGEKPGERHIGSKRRKFEPVVGKSSEESARVSHSTL